MGFVSNLFDAPQLIQYVFFPTLTSEEWERLNAPRLAAVFTFGAIVGMLFFAFVLILAPFLSAF